MSCKIASKLGLLESFRSISLNLVKGALAGGEGLIMRRGEEADTLVGSIGGLGVLSGDGRGRREHFSKLT